MIRKSISMLVAILIILTVFVPALSLAATKAYVKTPTANGAANIRSGPGTSYKVVAWGLNNDELEVLSEGASWHKVKLVKNGRTGYIRSTYVSSVDSGDTPSMPSTGFAGEAARVVTASGSGNVNLRKSAGGAVVATLVDGSKLVIKGKSGNWYEVFDLYSGHKGYMHKDYVAKTFTSLTSANVNLRKGAGTGYDIIKVLAKGTKVTVLEMGNEFSKVQAGSATGWISNKYLYIGC